MTANLRVSLIYCLSLLACGPSRHDAGDPVVAAPDLRSPSPAEVRPAAPDLGYACGAHSSYRARVVGTQRSPCGYDVSRVLSLGGDVKTRIRPPTIVMEFPDGTTFIGETDGVRFTAVRSQTFPFEDGCTWQALETLEGTVDAADECRLRATYRYREVPQSPPPCAQACTIDAQVVVDRVSVRID